MPPLARTNTSQSGQSLLIAYLSPMPSLRGARRCARNDEEGPSCRLPRRALLGMRRRRLADPGIAFPGLAPRLHPLLGDRTLAAHDGIEFLPVDRAEIIAALRLIPLEL